MPCLGLDGLKGHARLAQSRETRVAKGVAGAVAKSDAPGGVGLDLVKAVLRQRLSSARTLQHRERRSVENYRIRALLYAGRPNWRVLGSIVVR